MALDQSARSGLDQAFSATLPLKALPRFSGMELLVGVCGMLEGSGVVADLDPDLTIFDEPPEQARFWNRPKTPPRIGLVVNGVTMLIEGYDRPAVSEAELARLDLRSWPEGRARIARTPAHVEITEVQVSGGLDLDHNYDRAAAVTVVAAAVTGLTNAVAVIWRESLRAVPVEQLASMVAALTRGQAPVPLWLGRVGRPEGAPGAATRGLYPLLGAEIEVEAPDLTGDRAFEVALELATQILRSGEAPAHGEWLGYNRDIDFHVRHRAGSHAGPAPAVILKQETRPVEMEVAAGAA